jgi:hypothetical protein
VPPLRPALEPPSGYVDFVARNLEPVREEATRLVGDEHGADLLYPDALSDVAFRWGWLELQRRGFGRRDVAEVYLHRALERRWQAAQAAESARASRVDDDEPVDMFDIRVLTPDEAAWSVYGAPVRRAGPVASAAMRLAPQLQPTERPAFGPIADAAIAWWHAYEKWRRRRWALVGVVVFLIVVAFARWLEHR